MADVSGLADLVANINAMTGQLSAALPDIVMSGAAVIESEVRSRAPVDTGALISSLDAKSDRRKTAASATVEISRSGPAGTEHYAIFQEFGTSRMPAHPFFRPGVEAARPKVETLLTQQILSALESHDR